MASSAFVWAFTTAVLVCYLIYIKATMKKRRIRVKDGRHQMVVVVNTDLKMSRGKILSQFGHAIDGVSEQLADNPRLAEAWRASGSAKIALKGTQDQINQVYYSAKELGLMYYRVFDAGKTQVPAGSNTCIVVGPATKEDLDPVTGRLSLY